MALLDSDDMGLIALRASWATFSVALGKDSVLEFEF